MRSPTPISSIRGDDPIKVSRVDPFTLPNMQWIEALNRTESARAHRPVDILAPQACRISGDAGVGARSAMIEQYGLRVDRR